MTTASTSLPSGATLLPFSKFKPGMRVFSSQHGRPGNLLRKHKGTETLTVLLDGNVAGDHTEHPVNDLCLDPSDALDQVHPMLAKNIDDYAGLNVQQLVESEDWWMEKKYDGERQIVTVTPGAGPAAAAVRFTSRVVGKNTGRLGDNSEYLPHLETLFRHAVPGDGPTVFDGELMSTRFDTDEENFRYVASVMRSLAGRAVAVQCAEGPLNLRLYDCLWFNGADLRGLPFATRRQVLESWHQEAFAHVIAQRDTDHIALFSSVSISPQARTLVAKEAMLETSEAEGWEGVMLKYQGGLYTDTTKKDQRSPYLLKHKPFADTEVILVEFIGGRGEYNTEQFGAIRFAQWIPRAQITAAMNEAEVKANWPAHPNIKRLIEEASRSGFYGDYALVEVGTASGFTQAQEAEFRAAPDAFIAGVATIKYKSRLSDSGRMRHPHFKCMRDVSDRTALYTPATK